MNKINPSVLETMGNTPLIRLNRITQDSNSPQRKYLIAAKLDSRNPGGSVKDRICLSMILEAEKQGLLNPQTVIIEPTSGNIGIGLP